LANLHAIKLIVSRLCSPGHCSAERWTRQISWIWQETAVVNCCYVDL